MKKINTLDEAHELIQEVMKDVLQEIIIIDEDGEHHLIYVHSIDRDPKTGGVIIDFSTMSDRDHVYPYLVDVMTMQINEALEDLKKQSLWYKIKSFFGRVFKRGE